MVEEVVDIILGAPRVWVYACACVGGCGCIRVRLRRKDSSLHSSDICVH